MTKTLQLIASAPIAIAAMTVLPSTSAVAQEAPTIVLDLPAPAPAASPAPIILAPAEPAPIEIQLPEPEPVAQPNAVRDPAPVATTQTTSQPAAVTSTPAVQNPTNVASEPEAPAVADMGDQSATTGPALTAETAPAAPDLGDQRMVQPNVAAVDQPVDDNSSAALLFALLALGGIGLAAVMLVRSRRRRKDAAATVVERPIVAERTDDLAQPVASSEPEPAAYTTRSFSEPVVADDGNSPVALPAEMPRDPAERDRLLHRMIEAKPDRANPFASHKARAKRARLILQSIGTRFTDRKPGIDLSQYTNVWPELRDWRPATT